MSNCTVLTNKSGGPLEVKEGTAGVWRTLKILKDTEKYKIHLDPNATYREYWCATRELGSNQLYLSSDDCLECKSVTVKVEEGTYLLDRQYRDGKKQGGDVKTQDGFWAKILKFFGGGSTSTEIMPQAPVSASADTTENQNTGHPSNV